MAELKLIIEGEKVPVDKRFLELSVTIKDIVEQLNAEEIPIDKEETNVTKELFTKVYEFC